MSIIFSRSAKLLWCLFPMVLVTQTQAKPENATSSEAVVQIKTPATFAFKVFLDKREMGRHQVDVTPDEDGTRVKIAADFKVKVLFYTVFEYKHRVDELWQDRCLKSIDATTDNNGEALFLEGRAAKSSDKKTIFGVKSHLGEKTLNGCIRSFAYWDKSLLESRALLNMQTSVYEDVNFDFVGREQLKVNKKNFPADKYKLTAGEKEIILWYSPEGDWLALKSRTEDDRVVAYYLESAYD